MVEKVTKKPEGIITANHPVGAPLDVRSLPRRVTTVTIPLNADQITQPSRQTNNYGFTATKNSRKSTKRGFA